MGIHYDYKSTRAEKHLRKKQKKDERRNRKKRTTKSSENVIPLDKLITLDMLTDPKRNDI